MPPAVAQGLGLRHTTPAEDQTCRTVSIILTAITAAS